VSALAQPLPGASASGCYAIAPYPWHFVLSYQQHRQGFYNDWRTVLGWSYDPVGGSQILAARFAP
jgi:hypothetical protein